MPSRLKSATMAPSSSRCERASAPCRRRHPLGHLEAQVARHERLGLGGQVEAVEVRAGSARDLEHVAEAARGDEADGRAAPLDDGVGDQRRAVRQRGPRPGPRARARRARSARPRPGGGRRRHLARPHGPGGSQATRSVKVPPTSTPMRRAEVTCAPSEPPCCLPSGSLDMAYALLQIAAVQLEAFCVCTRSLTIPLLWRG